MSNIDPRNVIRAVEDKFFDDNEFSSVGDIAERINSSKPTVRNIVQDLEGTALYPVYSGTGLPTIYVTESIYTQLSDAFVDKYQWITELEFEEKRELKEKKEEINNDLTEYHELEKLLYASGTQLENAVCKALDLLDLSYETTEEDEDIRIDVGDLLFIIEIKGKSGAANKQNINQLGGWIEKWTDERDPSELQGVLLINNHRVDPPSERGEPLTEAAQRFLKLYGCNSMTTVELFQKIKEVKKENRDAETVIKEIFSTWRNE